MMLHWNKRTDSMCKCAYVSILFLHKNMVKCSVFQNSDELQQAATACFCWGVHHFCQIDASSFDPINLGLDFLDFFRIPLVDGQCIKMH